MGPMVRNARAEDAETVKTFIKEHMVNAFPDIPYEELKKKAESDIEKHCTSPSSFVLELDGNVIGYLGMSIDTDPYAGKKMGVLHMIHIDKGYRGKGYAHILMKKADEFFDKNNVVFKELTVNINNESAINLYKKHGYKLWRYKMKKV